MLLIAIRKDSNRKRTNLWFLKAKIIEEDQITSVLTQRDKSLTLTRLLQIHNVSKIANKNADRTRSLRAAQFVDQSHQTFKPFRPTN